MTLTNLPSAWDPEACTLPAVDRPLRLAEFDTIFTGLVSLDQLDPAHRRLHLIGGIGLETAVRDIAAREAQCCSFFTFTTTPVPASEGEQVTLDIEVPADQTAVLQAIAARAQTVAAQHQAA